MILTHRRLCRNGTRFRITFGGEETEPLFRQSIEQVRDVTNPGNQLERKDYIGYGGK